MFTEETQLFSIENLNGVAQEYLLTYLDYTNVTDYSFDSVFTNYLQK